MATITDAVQGPRAFLQLIEKLGHGKALPLLSKELNTVLLSIHEQWMDRPEKHKGELTLKLYFEVDQHGAVIVDYDVKRKDAPEQTLGAIFFFNDDAQLVQNNPRQPELPHVRDVSAPKSDVRDAADSREGSAE